MLRPGRKDFDLTAGTGIARLIKKLVFLNEWPRSNCRGGSRTCPFSATRGPLWFRLLHFVLSLTSPTHGCFNSPQGISHTGHSISSAASKAGAAGSSAARSGLAVPARALLAGSALPPGGRKNAIATGDVLARPETLRRPCSEPIREPARCSVNGASVQWRLPAAV